MKAILMSIHPEYVEKILDGTKKYEYRKRPTYAGLDYHVMLIYATAPIKKVVAIAEVKTELGGTKEIIWEMTKDKAGISEQEYHDYLCEHDNAVAIELGEVAKFDLPRDLADYGIKRAPQSFRYIDL